MRDIRFVAVHRGGKLTREQQGLLMIWAVKCSEHVLFLIGEKKDIRLSQALKIAEDWAAGKEMTGKAMKASVNAHAAARDSSDPVIIAVSRSTGQAAATAHMADHSIGAALYALKAMKLSGHSVDEERKWQEAQLGELPDELSELVKTTLREKGRSFRLWNI